MPVQKTIAKALHRQPLKGPDGAASPAFVAINNNDNNDNRFLRLVRRRT